MGGVQSAWWPTSDEAMFLKMALDPEAKLVAYAPVPCDEKQHANERSICVLKDEWTCHYPGCNSAITARKVNLQMQAFIHSAFNRGELTTYTYDAAELEKKMAEKVKRLQTSLRLNRKLGRAIVASTEDAPRIEEFRMRRVLREEATRMRAKRCRDLQKKLVIATILSTLLIFYFEVILPALSYRQDNDDPFEPGTCPP